MIKKILYFGNPSYLKKEQYQLKVEFPKDEYRQTRTIPIEDRTDLTGFGNLSGLVF